MIGGGVRPILVQRSGRRHCRHQHSAALAAKADDAYGSDRV